MPTQFYEMNLHGKDHIKEILYLDNKKSFTFNISPTSFFQTNIFQAEKMYSLAINILKKTDGKIDITPMMRNKVSFT